MFIRSGASNRRSSSIVRANKEESKYMRRTSTISIPLSPRQRRITVDCLRPDYQEMTPEHQSKVVERRITIIVRGKLFQTYESTLDFFPETLLGNKLFRSHYYDYKSNEYRFDRCFYSFDAILFYYQSKRYIIKTV